MNELRQIPGEYFLILSAILFAIGVMGVLTRKNGIAIFMSIELMVNAVNLTFLAYARDFHQMHGMIFVFFIMAIAAAEAAIGLAIFISLFHHRDTIDVDEANLMHW
ncbi:MAG: NADH-quinone oxidoreductase subunit NuoK [Thermoanaerobaculia bacterium]